MSSADTMSLAHDSSKSNNAMHAVCVDDEGHHTPSSSAGSRFAQSPKSSITCYRKNSHVQRYYHHVHPHRGSRDFVICATPSNGTSLVVLPIYVSKFWQASEPAEEICSSTESEHRRIAVHATVDKPLSANDVRYTRTCSSRAEGGLVNCHASCSIVQSSVPLIGWPARMQQYRMDNTSQYHTKRRWLFECPSNPNQHKRLEQHACLHHDDDHTS